MLNNFGAEKRPVVVLMPGWGGIGDVAAAQDAQSLMFANQGYVALNIGFHQATDVWYSDLAESAKAALDALCAQTYADCSAVVITGESYGGTQIHPVVRYLRGLGVFDGSDGANAGRKVVAMLGQDSGYTYYGGVPRDADAIAYSIAMIENLGDLDFPVDSCDWGNCGARNRADYHQTAAGSEYVLSYCPAGGSHGSRGYADWDAWVLSAVKTMLHNQRGVPKFTGYVEPSLAVSNACVTTPLSPSAPTIGTATAGNASISVAFTPGALGSGTLINYTADCGGVTHTGGSSPITVPGLTNGTSYTCRMKTTTTVGNSAWSAPSNAVTPGTPGRFPLEAILMLLLD
jgi:dienelactone hydrolase